jgi:hypothetical protein
LEAVQPVAEGIRKPNILFNAGIKSLRATLPDEIFTGNFASLTVHVINICVKIQQMKQLFIQFINYVW